MYRLLGSPVRAKLLPRLRKINRPVPSESPGMSVGRLETFSDGVFAIVITLLILHIGVPGSATGHLGRQLVRQWPEYFAYLLSFLIIGIIWLQHHAAVRMLARTNHTVQVLNLLFLLAVSILPWSTAVVSDYVHEGTRGDMHVAVVVYGASLSLMAITFNIFWRGLRRHDELHHPDVSRESLTALHRLHRIAPAVLPLITLLGLLSGLLFMALILALAALNLLPTPDVRSAGAGQLHHGGNSGST
jgi:uncharacterized membrane protein